MDFSADRSADGAVRTELLKQLRRRLETALGLTLEVRDGLAGGDAAAIDNASARMETAAQEFKLLAQEYDRLPALAEMTPDLEAERAALERAAERIARSAAVTGGLLERMVAISRGLLGLLASARDGTYSSAGRCSGLEVSGLRLRERA
jgi:hypothetical protein